MRPTYVTLRGVMRPMLSAAPAKWNAYNSGQARAVCVSVEAQRLRVRAPTAAQPTGICERADTSYPVPSDITVSPSNWKRPLPTPVMGGQQPVEWRQQTDASTRPRTRSASVRNMDDTATIQELQHCLAEARAELRDSRDRYRSIFEAIDEEFYIIDLRLGADAVQFDDRFEEVNPAFERQTVACGLGACRHPKGIRPAEPNRFRKGEGNGGEHHGEHGEHRGRQAAEKA